MPAAQPGTARLARPRESAPSRDRVTVSGWAESWARPPAMARARARSRGRRAAYVAVMPAKLLPHRSNSGCNTAM